MAVDSPRREPYFDTSRAAAPPPQDRRPRVETGAPPTGPRDSGRPARGEELGPELITRGPEVDEIRAEMRRARADDNYSVDAVAAPPKPGLTWGGLFKNFAIGSVTLTGAAAAFGLVVGDGLLWAPQVAYLAAFTAVALPPIYFAGKAVSAVAGKVKDLIFHKREAKADAADAAELREPSVRRGAAPSAAEPGGDVSDTDIAAAMRGLGARQPSVADVGEAPERGRGGRR